MSEKTRINEKITKLRQKLIEELEKLEDGIVIKLDHDKQLLDAILFEGDNTVYYHYKKFAFSYEIIKKIDLSNVSFDKFLAREFSFKGLTGVNINPQEIYNKDLEKATLEGVNFIGPFDGCYINYADFTGSVGAKINPQKIASPYYISGCKFSGVTFIEPFNGRKYDYTNIFDVDFTGSKGAIIQTNTLLGKHNLINSLEDCKLTDATIKGGFDGVEITGVNFEGAKGKLEINPQTIKSRSLAGTKLCGVTFWGRFDGCYLKNADFTGSYGALIDISLLGERNCENANFTDAKVIGLEKNGLRVNEQGFIETGLEENLNKVLGIEHETELIKKQQLEEARKRLIELNKIKIKEKIKELSQLIQTQAYLGIPESKIYGSIPITQEVFLKKVDNHFEIDEEFIDISLLRFLNLSLIDFTNVKVSGIDFRHTFARIHPQTVYRKDISNCTFDDANVKFFDDFSGVIMDGADFNECDFDTFKIVK